MPHHLMIVIHAIVKTTVVCDAEKVCEWGSTDYLLLNSLSKQPDEIMPLMKQ